MTTSAKPPPLPTGIERTIPDWVRWLAQDKDGAWWGYEHEPNEGHQGWYENEVGRYIILGRGVPPFCWQDQLLRYPPGR